MTKTPPSATGEGPTADELAAENVRLREENERLREHFRMTEPTPLEPQEEPPKPLLVLLLPDPASAPSGPDVPGPEEMMGLAGIQRSFYQERNPDWEVWVEHDLDRIPDRALVRPVYHGGREIVYRPSTDEEGNRRLKRVPHGEVGQRYLALSEAALREIDRHLEVAKAAGDSPRGAFELNALRLLQARFDLAHALWEQGEDDRWPGELEKPLPDPPAWIREGPSQQ